MPPATLAQYEAMVNATLGAELKGASMPYTSVAGNMHSFLDKIGRCAIRLGKSEREQFLQEFNAELYHHESGIVMQEYVTLPPTLLGDARKAAGWLKKSLAYAKTLKPKATTRKKSA
jgi:protein involved in ribonucleotide reduction